MISEDVCNGAVCGDHFHSFWENRERLLEACSGRTYAGIPYYVTHAHGEGITIRLVPACGECRNVDLTYEQAQDAGIEV